MKKSILFIIMLITHTVIFSQSQIDNNGNSIEDNLSDIQSELSFDSNNRSSGNPKILKAFKSPTNSPNDMAYDGEHLWISGFNEYVIYRVSTEDGAVLKEIPCPALRPYGLAFDGTDLWLTNNTELSIHKIDTLDGTILATFPSPADPSLSYPEGLAWTGKTLWHNDTKEPSSNTSIDSIFNIDTNGLLLDASPHNHIKIPIGLTYDGTHLWSSDNSNSTLYKLEMENFTPIDSINAPGGRFPNGLAFDGTHLWVSNNDLDSIYQIALGPLDTSIDDIQILHNKFQVSPNPSSGIFNFTSKENIDLSNAKIEVFTIHGELVSTHHCSSPVNATIDLEFIDDGIYLYFITDNRQNSYSGKIIKAKR